jgi:tRNA(Arg) A34 adenosine deaminase TadA
MTPEQLMQAAIEIARAGIAAGQSPFGAVVARDGEIVAAAHNTVWATTDISAHAEVNAIRSACRELKSINLAGCEMFTTCEPCPMCLSAIHWGRFDTVYFGATISDAKDAGFSELIISAEDMVRMGGSPLRVVPGVLSRECADLFRAWMSRADRRAY